VVFSAGPGCSALLTVHGSLHALAVARIAGQSLFGGSSHGERSDLAANH